MIRLRTPAIEDLLEITEIRERAIDALLYIMEVNNREERCGRGNRRGSFSTGTVVEALPSDFRGAAGSNHGLTVWDEAWAYTSEASCRLWDELTPVLTRLNCLRLIVTYAGFPSEVGLLWDLYQRGTLGEPVDELFDLGNGDADPAGRCISDLFSYWDHVGRMPWQTQDYLTKQNSSLRANAYLRLHENRRTKGNESFIDLAWWDACTDPDFRR